MILKDWSWHWFMPDWPHAIVPEKPEGGLQAATSTCACFYSCPLIVLHAFTLLNSLKSRHDEEGDEESEGEGWADRR